MKCRNKTRCSAGNTNPAQAFSMICLALTRLAIGRRKRIWRVKALKYIINQNLNLSTIFWTDIIYCDINISPIEKLILMISRENSNEGKLIL